MKPRHGIALVLAIVVLAMIEAMTAGLLALTTHSRTVAASQLRALRAQNAAELAAGSVLARWRTDRFDTLRIGEVVAARAGSGASGDLAWQTMIERLASATYLLRSTARAGSPFVFATGRAAAVFQTIDRQLMIAESNAAISSGGPLVIAQGSASSENLPPPGWAALDCPATDILPSPAALLSARAPLIGTPAIAGAVAQDSMLEIMDSLALGAVKWSELADIADRIESGTITPAPTAISDACVVSAPSNWGDPRDPAGPCGGFFPLIYAPGNLELRGGVGQGILAVEGTLTLSGGAYFVGYIVAMKGVLLDHGAVVRGAIRSRSDYALIGDAAVSYSRCAVARAVLSSSATTRLISRPRTFIPAF